MKDWQIYLVISGSIVFGSGLLTNSLGITIEMTISTLIIGGIVLLIRRGILKVRHKLEKKQAV